MKNRKEATSSAASRIKDFINSQLKNNNIQESFPAAISSLRESDVNASCKSQRRDLTHLSCFTLDCDQTKDMDDAVSINRMKSGNFLLGVHIADVSAYIEPGSPLDDIAIERGTSIYLPDRTIPMLPPILSDDLCSLNPNVERNAVSIMAEITSAGEIISYEIFKSVIKSRVKGVYGEVNQIIAGTHTPAIREKYRPLIQNIFLMKSLAKTLQEKRIERGAKPSDVGALHAEVINEKVRITYKTQGFAEAIIQEFMILANEIIAKHFSEVGLPVIQRVHPKTGEMAFYSASLHGHADLAASDYAHFTSPIRRLADLKVHQILTAYLDGMAVEDINEKFHEVLDEVCEIATKRMRRAANVERAALTACEVEFFKSRKNKRFAGRMIGVDKHNHPVFELEGLHVKLPSFARISASIGEKFSFSVGIGKYTGKLGLYRMRVVVA